MKNVNDLADLFLVQLEVLRNIEESLHKAFPALIKKIKYYNLNTLLSEYKNTINENLKIINRIFDILEITPESANFKVVDDLIENTKKIIEKHQGHYICESSLILIIKCIIHIKIAYYETLKTYAKTMNKNEFEITFNKLLKNENKINLKFSKLALDSVNIKAKPNKMENSLL